MVRHLHDIGEVNLEHLFIDGTKIEANANRYTFVWKKVVSMNEAKMFTKIQSCIESINITYMTNFTVVKETLLDDIKRVLNYLEEKKEQLKPGYNIQINVENEYITGIGVFQDRTDNATLNLFLNDYEKQKKKSFKMISVSVKTWPTIKTKTNIPAIMGSNLNQLKPFIELR